MKRIDAAKIGTLIANIGVIGGLLLLTYEVRQNNELMAADARLNRVNMVVDAWRVTAENGELADIRIRDNNGEDITDAERHRIDSHVMSVYVVLDWTFQELSENSAEMNQVREVQRYNFATHAGYRRVWEARKSSFRPDFVRWMEDNVVNQ